MSTRTNSLERLRDLGIDTDAIDFGPTLVGHTAIRPPPAILKRAHCIAIASNVANGFPAEEARPTVEQLELGDHLTQDERAVFAGQMSDHDLAAFSYCEEAALTMSWALGVAPLSPGWIESGELLVRLYDAGVEDLSPRPLAEIEAELDHVHCALTAARANPEAARIVGPFFVWRHAALVWMLQPTASWPPAPIGFPF